MSAEDSILKRMAEGARPPLREELQTSAPPLGKGSVPPIVPQPPVAPTIQQQGQTHQEPPSLQPGNGSFTPPAPTLDQGQNSVPPLSSHAGANQQESHIQGFHAVNINMTQIRQEVEAITYPNQVASNERPSLDHSEATRVKDNHVTPITQVSNEAPMLGRKRLHVEEVNQALESTNQKIQDHSKVISLMEQEIDKIEYHINILADMIPNFMEIHDSLDKIINEQLKKDVDELNALENNRYASKERVEQFKKGFKTKAISFTTSLIKQTFNAKGIDYNEKMINYYAKYIVEDKYEYSILTDLLKDDDITEIMIPEYNNVYIEKNGKTTLAHNLYFRDWEHLKNIIDLITRDSGRKLNDKTPNLDTRLPDKSRVSASIPPIAVNGPEMTIRKFPKEPWTLEKLFKLNSLSEEMLEFTKAVVRANISAMVSGGTGAGKTSFLNAISNYMNPEHRILVLENVHELNLQLPHVVYFEEKTVEESKDNPVTLNQLVINALRKKPKGIIVGEVRGGEALALLQALSTGHYGYGTGHADSPRQLFSRLDAMVMMSGVNWEIPVINSFICYALGFIFQVKQLKDGSRKLTQITEILGTDSEGAFKMGKLMGEENPRIHDASTKGLGYVYLHDVYKYIEEGEEEDGQIIGHWARSKHRPYCFNELVRKGGLKDYWKGE